MLLPMTMMRSGKRVEHAGSAREADRGGLGGVRRLLKG